MESGCASWSCIEDDRRSIVELTQVCMAVFSRARGTLGAAPRMRAGADDAIDLLFQ